MDTVFKWLVFRHKPLDVKGLNMGLASVGALEPWPPEAWRVRRGLGLALGGPGTAPPVGAAPGPASPRARPLRRAPCGLRVVCAGDANTHFPHPLPHSGRPAGASPAQHGQHPEEADRQKRGRQAATEGRAVAGPGARTRHGEAGRATSTSDGRRQRQRALQRRAGRRGPQRDRRAPGGPARPGWPEESGQRAVQKWTVRRGGPPVLGGDSTAGVCRK